MDTHTPECRGIKKYAVNAVDNGPDVRQPYKPSSGAGLFFLDLSDKSWNKNLTDRLTAKQ